MRMYPIGLPKSLLSVKRVCTIIPKQDGFLFQKHKSEMGERHCYGFPVHLVALVKHDDMNKEIIAAIIPDPPSLTG